MAIVFKGIQCLHKSFKIKRPQLQDSQSQPSQCRMAGIYEAMLYQWLRPHCMLRA